MAQAVQAPPPTPVEPVTEILHGIEITDPYRWLEDQNSPRTRKWLEEQTAYTRAYLDAIPGRELVRKRIEELLGGEVLSEPWKASNRFFFLKRAPWAEQAIIAMREGVSEEDVPLIDPSSRREGMALSVNILTVSSNGKLLAYAVRRGGNDDYAVEVLDVENRTTLADRLPVGACSGLAFSPDGTGIFYTHELTGGSPQLTVKWHQFGRPFQEDAELFVVAGAPDLQLSMYASPDCHRLVYLVKSWREPASVEVYLHDLFNNSSAERIVEHVEGLFCPFFTGNRLLVLSDWQAPNGRILAIDLDMPQRNNWREIVAESQMRIHAFAVVGDLMFMTYVDNNETLIEIFDQFGQRQGNLSFPPKGTASFVSGQTDGDTLFYQFSSFSDPPTIFAYNVRSRTSEIWAASRVPIQPSSLEIEKIMYTSKDETEIPMFLVYKRGSTHSDARPCFLTAYGGFGASMTPKFAAYSTCLVERGFLVGVAAVRGGSEFGVQWHLAGKRHNQQNTIDDFVAAAEWMLANKRTAAEKLAIGGGSNGGLVVGAALTQRPELFRAAICVGPLLDMLRYHKFDLADRWIDEFGSAENANDFPFLNALSPYQRVRDGTAYPAVMFVSGDADTRCNAMHVRKMTSKLQAATSSAHPILLDHKPTWGHVPTQPLSSRIQALTDRLAFLCHELGVTLQ
jgi:prolyl oligopeptidase